MSTFRQFYAINSAISAGLYRGANYYHVEILQHSFYRRGNLNSKSQMKTPRKESTQVVPKYRSSLLSYAKIKSIIFVSLNRRKLKIITFDLKILKLITRLGKCFNRLRCTSREFQQAKQQKLKILSSTIAK